MKSSFFSSFRELYAARHEPENVRPLAEAYWRALLVLSALLIIGILFFGAWEFASVMRKISTSSNGNAPKVDVLDRTKLEDTLAKFAERQSTYEAAKGKKPGLSDPSR